jgi:hypothetical protein
MQRDSASDARGVTSIAMVARPFPPFLAHSGAVSWVNKEPQMEIVVSSWEVLRGLAQKVGPYLLVEAVMPGGTLLALLLYLYRARRGA